LAAAGARPQALLAGAPTRPGSAIHLGAQTNAWPIDPNDLSSLLNVLDQIRKIGYEGFETGYFNLMNHSALTQEVHSRIAATGLAFFGLHIAIGVDKCDPRTLLPPALLYRTIAVAALKFGAQNLILSGAQAQTSEAAKRKAEGLIAAANFGAGIGLPVLYHNHELEFAQGAPGSKVEMDTLFDETEHTSVCFLLDAGHAYRGGGDVIGLIGRRLDRIAAFHMRDFVDRKEVPLGQGSFPLAQCAAVLRNRRWSGWALNEEDNDGGQKLGLAVIEPAYHALYSALE
jgi:sugar phosphate isomerase/epimerase